MLYTEPRITAAPTPLGRFASYEAQEQADLSYGGQRERLQVLATKAPEQRPDDTIPAPPTPPTR